MSDSLRLNAFFRFRIFCVSISKRVLVQNLSYEKDFDLQENEPQTQFHINRFARRLVLTQRQKPTRKWPIYLHVDFNILFHF